MAKFITAAEAAQLVRDDDALIVAGFGSYASPEELMQALSKRYEAEGHPKNITAICGITPGDKTESLEPGKGMDLGLNRLKAPGLIGTVYVGNLTDARAIAYMAGNNEIAAYIPPMGVMCNLFRAVAGGRPGVITRVGLGTFADPRIEGCAVNQKARDKGSIVSLMEIDGEEYLFYKSFKPNVCFLRATYADEDGNLSMIHEGVQGSELEIAVGTHNNGGIVIAQVEQIVARGSLPTRDVRIHGKLVDYVVVAQDPYNQRQCYARDGYRPELCGLAKTPAGGTKKLPLTARKILARRAAMELQPGLIINIGSGIPSGIGSVAAEEGINQGLTTSVESGPMGGEVQEGLSFPGVANAEAIFYQCDTIDMYDGGMLDVAFLGFAEVDKHGNVNVSKFAGRCIGAGGFINISQNAKKVFFMGTFGNKAELEIGNGGIKVLAEGKGRKFVDEVQQITFSGDYAVKSGQEITYLTERCVFKLTADGLMITEIARGIDLEKDILAHMAFRPLIAEDLKFMDERLFGEEKMGLKV